MPELPRVLLVGGPDVDARLELMHQLKDTVNVGAVGANPSLQPKFQGAGFDYYPYPLSRQVDPGQDLMTIFQLTALFRRLQPQIVHTFDTKPGVWGCLAARLARVPIIISTITGLGSLYTSNDLSTRATRALYQGLQKLACQLSAVTIFQNNDDAQQFTSSGVTAKHKATVILGSGVATNVFDPDRISPQARAGLRAELGLEPEAIVVTMIARLIRSKGVIEFLNAAAEIRTQYPEVQFLLVGADDPQSLDRLKPDELNQLEQYLTWPGPRSDIPAVLAASDIFVLPSAYAEGIPRVLLEAAAMGLPLITTDSPGCNEVALHEVNGFLVPPHNPAALNKAIMQLVTDASLRHRFGLLSRRRAVDLFDLRVVAGQTRNLYRQLLAYKSLLPVT